MPSTSTDPSTVPAHVDALIEELVAGNRKAGTRQGNEAEYRCIARAIERHHAGNLLIFGVGRDSSVWLEANRGGTTVFLEHEPEASGPG